MVYDLPMTNTIDPGSVGLIARSNMGSRSTSVVAMVVVVSGGFLGMGVGEKLPPCPYSRGVVGLSLGERRFSKESTFCSSLEITLKSCWVSSGWVGADCCD